ncbi:hypothetical protein FSARC_7580 [Fusarium sarcochroum]|uniref:Uncharacterized protein n=1 Tax=Fusarium sarcochroum TaxID=1208366 RepID=A0A8H4TUV9_9HYPO|nr:hypothetical protein FSARC_7580 [Fusarium sarcochroum]
MEPQKSYLEFSPQGHPGERFPGASIPVDVRNTAVRREHLRAYFAFMRPAVAHFMHHYGKRATEITCKELYASNKRAVPSQFFELMVDRNMWKIWFNRLGSEGPNWPWGSIFSVDLAEGEIPSNVFAHYCETIRPREAQTTSHVGISGYISVSAASAQLLSTSPNTLVAPKPDNEFVIYDEAPLASDKDVKRGPSAGSSPFEAETPWYLPAEEYICKDLPAINKLLKIGTIKFNATTRCVILAPNEGVSPDNQDLLRVWQMVQNWLTLIGQAKVITLLEHLSGISGFLGK